MGGPATVKPLHSFVAPSVPHRPALPARIRQRHYVGGNDRVVPEKVVRRGRIEPETVVVIPSFDHTCCWEAVWTTVLADIGRETRSAR